MNKLKAAHKIPVGISSCLLGERVRYDGGHKFHSGINATLGRYFKFLPFCPEVAIGLGVPREPVKLITQGNSTRCISTLNPELDITDQLTRCADNESDGHQSICAYIFKTRSPSCGPDAVKLLDGANVTQEGVGIYARQLMDNFPLMPITDEEKMDDPKHRASFVQRATVYQHWKALLKNELNWEVLNAFHSRHLAMATDHDSQQSRNLSMLLAHAERGDIATFKETYITRLSAILATPLCS